MLALKKSFSHVDEAGDVIDPDGQTRIPVWLIERETLRFMTADELNAYADAHPDWLAHRPYSTGQVRVEACAGRYL